MNIWQVGNEFGWVYSLIQNQSKVHSSLKRTKKLNTPAQFYITLLKQLYYSSTCLSNYRSWPFLSYFYLILSLKVTWELTVESKNSPINHGHLTWLIQSYFFFFCTIFNFSTQHFFSFWENQGELYSNRHTGSVEK